MNKLKLKILLGANKKQDKEKMIVEPLYHCLKLPQKRDVVSSNQCYVDIEVV